NEPERVETLRKRGQVAELLSTREVRGIEPGASPALLGALYAPLRGQADPGKATQAFARLAERARARGLHDPPGSRGAAVTRSRPPSRRSPGIAIAVARRLTSRIAMGGGSRVTSTAASGAT